jgi:hypothetical protein
VQSTLQSPKTIYPAIFNLTCNPTEVEITSSRLFKYIIVCILIVGQTHGLIEATDGWNVAGEGQGSSQGYSNIGGSGGDPSITLGITSSSSVYGFGFFSDHKTGNQDMTLNLGGYNLTAGYSGDVQTSVALYSPGSAAATALIVASSTGLSTGGGSYDLFGAADIQTDGYISGQGSANSVAEGSAQFGASKTETPSEIWGQLNGESSLNLLGSYYSSLAGTGGQENGLHTEARSTQNIDGSQTASSMSWINSYVSTINNAKADATSSGTAMSGAWDPSFISSKVKLNNENVAATAIGALSSYAESNDLNDAADASSIVKASASKGETLEAQGGPANYVASTQSSNAPRTYSSADIIAANWGSVARTSDFRKTTAEWGVLDQLSSEARMNSAGYAVSFGKILQKAIYTQGTPAKAIGNLTLDTYAEASKNKIAFASTEMIPNGEGTIISDDINMSNKIKFSGYLNHSSMVDSQNSHVLTSNRLGSIFVSSAPAGSENFRQPFMVNTTVDPNVAWSQSLAGYVQRS